MQVLFQPISSQVDSASTNGFIDLGSIYGPVKPKTVKQIGIHRHHSFPAWRSAMVDRWALSRWQINSKIKKLPSLSPGQDNMVNKM